MQDELDATLMRRFATARAALPAEPFLASLTARLRARRSLSSALPSVLGTIVSGLADGILVPLRLKLTRYALLGAAAMTLLSVFS
jgi:hypothetical protein